MQDNINRIDRDISEIKGKLAEIQSDLTQVWKILLILISANLGLNVSRELVEALPGAAASISSLVSPVIVEARQLW